MDAPRGLLESKSREECVFFAAGVGVVQTLRVDEARDDDSAEVTLNPPQRHFRGHADDVRCLAVHERTRVAASGEMGLEPAAMVWSLDARSGEPALAVLRHPRGARAIIGVAFDARGDRVATVAGDDGHTVSLWAWDTGGHEVLDKKLRRAARRTHALVGAVVPDHPPRGPGRAIFTGPARPGPARDLRRDARALLEAGAEKRKRAEKRGGEEAPLSERAPWRVRAGKNLRVEDVCSGAFVDWCAALEGSDALRARVEGVRLAIPHLDAIPAAEEGLRRGAHFVSGTPRGKLLFWENGDGTVPAREIPGSRHRGAVQALALSLDRQRAGAPRLLLSGDAAGAVMCWAVDPLSGRVARAAGRRVPGGDAAAAGGGPASRARGLRGALRAVAGERPGERAAGRRRR